MDEEPAVDAALSELMKLLDYKVPKLLVSRFPIHKDSVQEAEQFLLKPMDGATWEQVSESRRQTEEALRGWVQALADHLHYTST